MKMSMKVMRQRSRCRTVSWTDCDAEIFLDKQFSFVYTPPINEEVQMSCIQPENIDTFLILVGIGFVLWAMK